MAATEEKIKANVQNDLNNLRTELSKRQGKFLFGDSLSAADIMMEFIVDFTLGRELGTKGGDWKQVEQYKQDCQATSSWQKATKKTGYKL